ncbi:MAG: 50S ribosomal protein L11 methyltransferase [Alphaproteobacteria bacterium]|nr:MAG: 50S ribosomal protein L11 methyltransferase [Alphaproteobacteria bacterium]
MTGSERETDPSPLWLWRLRTSAMGAAEFLERLEAAWESGEGDVSTCRWLAGSITGLPQDPAGDERATVEILLAGNEAPNTAERDRLIRTAMAGGRSAAASGKEIEIHDEPPQRLAPRDWVAESQKALPPIAVGRLFIHGSHDRSRRRGYGLDLEIEAGEAFGTGHHGTTLGCLALLEAMARAGQRMRPKRILEVGTGSGILALAATRLWRVPVIAGDIDPAARRVVTAHMKTNAVPRLAAAKGIGPGILPLVAAGTGHRSIREGAPYDLVIANILRGPLIAMAGELVRPLAEGGRLLLSGLLARQMPGVIAHYRARGLVLERTLIIAGWACLLLQRPAGICGHRRLPAIAPARTS